MSILFCGWKWGHIPWKLSSKVIVILINGYRSELENQHARSGSFVGKLKYNLRRQSFRHCLQSPTPRNYSSEIWIRISKGGFKVSKLSPTQRQVIRQILAQLMKWHIYRLEIDTNRRRCRTMWPSVKSSRIRCSSAPSSRRSFSVHIRDASLTAMATVWQRQLVHIIAWMIIYDRVI